MPEKRVTSHRNDETGKYDVMVVTDGEDGLPESTEVVASFDTSPEANDHIRKMQADLVKESRGQGDDNTPMQTPKRTGGDNNPSQVARDHTRREGRDEK